MKNNGDLVTFLKQKDYIMVNNDLGGGSFGKTVLLKDPFIDELFVAKLYQPEYKEIQERFFKNFLDEIKIMYKLNHKNIVRIYNYYAYEKQYTGYILMEYIAGVNIEEFIENYDFFSEITLDEVFVQLIDGFSYIEEQGIIHRDIREGNILVDKNGIVKIIDFGIGKIFDNIPNQEDSLVGDINRVNSDTLPEEYYKGIYTSQTDIFYLGELLNRLIEKVEPDYKDFTYGHILKKMMTKRPEDRYLNFREIRREIDEQAFRQLGITDSDKRIYQTLVHHIYDTLNHFIGKPEFVRDVDVFSDKLENVLNQNLFEDEIQNNAHLINCVVVSGYNYRTRQKISCEAVKCFLKWFKGTKPEMQKIILSNMISKLSNIDIVSDDLELPFN